MVDRWVDLNFISIAAHLLRVCSAWQIGHIRYCLGAKTGPAVFLLFLLDYFHVVKIKIQRTAFVAKYISQKMLPGFLLGTIKIAGLSTIAESPEDVVL